MSPEQDSLLDTTISNDELRRRLTHEFQVECGPVTPSTRRVLLKKLSKLESERNLVSVPNVSVPRILNGDSFKQPLTRPPIRRAIRRLTSDNNGSTLQNFSDSESDVDDIKSDKLCKMLLSHRPGLGRVRPATTKSSSYSTKISTFFTNLKQKIMPNLGKQPDASSNYSVSTSSNFISIALLIFVIIFFVVIFSIYFYAKFTFKSNHTLDLNDYPFAEDKVSLSHFLRVLLWYIIAAGVAVCVPVLFYFYYRQTQRAAREEQNLVYDLIEKSIELLQSPDEPQSMPVLHIRDTLLSQSERKSSKYRRIWNKVVNHIEKSESRVKVEFKKIDGEDFKAWKWIAVKSPANYLLSENENDLDGDLATVPQTQKIGGVEWQGQAFGSVLGSKPTSPVRSSESDLSESISVPTATEAYRNKNFSALTRYLKIRNIFDKEAQYLDPDWTTKIKNTILEKTAATSPNGSHDIVHIELEDNPNEGLVYLKCASIPAATNAFHALHGWWCEKKLVSVKFLKEDRYNQRFPQAKKANTPLLPTPSVM